MKTFLITIFLITNIAYAKDKPLNNIEDARAVKASLTGLIYSSGISGVGIAGCDPKTGVSKNRVGDYVYCTSILTSTKEADAALNILFPQGSKIEGIFVEIVYTGRFEPQ